MSFFIIRMTRNIVYTRAGHSIGDWYNRNSPVRGQANQRQYLTITDISSSGQRMYFTGIKPATNASGLMSWMGPKSGRAKLANSGRSQSNERLAA